MTLGSNLLALVEVALLEALRVDRVDLVELQPWLGLERGERPDRLGRQRPAVDQEEHPASDAGLHEPVDLVDHASASCRCRSPS